jgi:Tfp pilus assembly protein PilX
MVPRSPTAPDQRGIALPMTVFTMAALSLLVMAFLSMATMEPQVAANLQSTTQALYLADAGMEWAFDQLASTTSWNSLFATTTPSVSNLGGTFTVQIRNDTTVADRALTGLTSNDASATTDANDVVIVVSTGTVNGVTRQIQAAVSRTALPSFPAAVNLPGLQADTNINGSGGSSVDFKFDGRDYYCSTSSSCNNDSDWSLTTNPMKYGVATNTGTQANAGVTYEQRAESGFNNTSKQDNVYGCNQSTCGASPPASTSAVTQGLSTIAPTSSLTMGILDSFVSAVGSNPATTVLQSTQACPMVLTGSSTSTPSTSPTLTNGSGVGCTVNENLDLGTRTNPKLVYFKGELDPSSNFAGLTLNGNIQGAGILIVEDGDLVMNGTFRWDGVVIVTGRYVGAGFRDNSNVTINGAFVSAESVADEASGYYELRVRDVSSVRIRASKQTVDAAQVGVRQLYRVLSWKEI